MRSFLIVLFSFLFLSFSWSQDIFDACRSGNIERLKELHKINPDTINSINDNGFSPLIIATYSSKLESVEYLLKHKVNVDFESPEGTALVGACYKGNLEISELLIKYSANVNVVGGNNISPLIFAVQSKNKKLVELLLKNGADKTIIDSAGRTAYDYVVLMKIDELIDLFESK